MALQGDLQSFALNDVLRLLSGTSKSGRLAVTSGGDNGDVWLDGGGVVGGAVSSAPFATDVVDVVMELLRFVEGAFTFHDDETISEPAEPADVDTVLARAEELLAEWKEVEAVVPSMEGWVVFAPEIEGEQTTVTAAHWRVLAALGGGLTVRELGAHFEQTDLVASRQVKELVEAGLARLDEAPADRPEPVVRREASASATETTEATEPVGTGERDDLSVLRAEDGPVVIETSEDALLPEPLPGSGTSFTGDLDDMTAVDGRDTEPEPESDSEPDAGPGAADFDPLADDAHGIEFGDPEPPVTRFSDGTEVGAGDAEPFADADDFFGSAEASDAPSEEVDADPLDSTPSTDADGGSGDGGDDGDRGALLDFLSSVKP